MNFSKYRNFHDFIEKNGMTISEGIDFLKQELDRLEKENQ